MNTDGAVSTSELHAFVIQANFSMWKVGMLPAIRREFDPFDGFVFYPIFRIIRWTAYECPFCRRVFKLSWGQNALELGPSVRRCRKCDKDFLDGSHEWPFLSQEQKRNYLLPVSVAGVLAGFLVLFGILVYDRFENVNVGVAIVLLAILFVFCVIWFGFRLIQIARSNSRVSSEGSIQK